MKPKWSPDGTKIACRKRKSFGLWVMNQDGSNMIQVSSEPIYVYRFFWLPDSKNIVFTGESYTRENGILITSRKVNLFNIEAENEKIIYQSDKISIDIRVSSISVLLISSIHLNVFKIEVKNKKLFSCRKKINS